MSNVKIMVLGVCHEAVVSKNQQRKSSLETVQLDFKRLRSVEMFCMLEATCFSSVEATVQQLTVLLHLKAQPACHRSSVGCKMANDLTLSHPYCVSDIGASCQTTCLSMRNIMSPNESKLSFFPISPILRGKGIFYFSLTSLISCCNVF